MKKGFYLAILFLSTTLTSLVSASEGAFLTKLTMNAVPESENTAGSASLVTLPISGSFCSGSTIVVNFSNLGFGFGSDNVINAELSDANGDFSSPTSISISPVSFVGNAADGFVYALIPNGTPAGTGYRIRVTSSNPISTSADNGSDITITSGLAPVTPTVIQSGPSSFCFGSASTFLTSSSAQNNLWFPGGVNTNPFIGVVSEGCYYTQVSGSNGCSTSSNPICIEVNTPIFTYLGYFENDNLVTTTDTTITICEGDSTQIGFIIEGGTPPYNIFYTPNGLDILTLNGVGEPYNSESYFYTFNVSNPGFYQLIGIEDAFITPCGSAGNSGLVTIQNSPAPITSFSYNPFCGPLSQAPIGDAGFVSGGSYSFDTAPSDAATIDATTGIISNATIGNTYIIRYTVAVAFCNGSIRTSTTSITVSPTDISSFTIAPFCNNAPSLAPVGAPGFATGGTYSFQSSPTDAAQIDPSTGVITNASANATYIIAYTSPAGTCQNSSSTSVTTFESPSVTATIQNTLCGQSTGSIDVSVSGGLSPYTYIWSNSASTQDISTLASGAYSLTVNDGNGCSVDTSFSIIDSNKPVLELIASATTCGNSNGAINLIVTEGSGNYTYLWTPGDIASEDISGLDAGSYSVEVTDLTTTCVVNGSASITNQDAPSVTFTKVDATCTQSNGSIDVSVSLNGGSSSITHSWNNGSTSEDLTGLAVGTYIDTVRDGNGCEVIISVDIINSNQFTANSSVTNPTCGNANGGAIDISIQGGEAPFAFVWSPNTTSTTEDVSGLTAGEYTVEITDAANCSTSVTSTILPAINVTLTSTKTLATCGNLDGAIDLSVTGASGSYTFLWSNLSTSEDIASLDTGSYSVTVTDVIDLTCTSSLTVDITYGNLPSLTLDALPTSCTTNNGSIDLTVIGGSSNYSYSWTGPNSFTSSSEDISDLSTGSYSVIVNDNSTSCSVTGSVNIGLANAPSLSAVVANTTCGQENGIIDITITGGTEPFTLVWSNAVASQDQINLSAGDYSLSITDINGCSIDTMFTILPSEIPFSGIIVTQPICNGPQGEIQPNIVNLVEPVTYSWTKDGAPFSNSEVISNLEPALYALVATDINGCTFSLDTVLSFPNQPIVVSAVSNTLCGLSTGAIDVTVSGGSPEYTFSWTNDNGFTSSQEDITGLAFGCYSLSVTDATGCEVTAEACVENDNAPVISFNAVNASCNQSNGSITASVSGGVYPYSYSWGATIADTDSIITNLSAGDYSLTVTDLNGCFVSESVSLINTGIPTLTVNQINASCGLSDGSIDLVVSGGIAPYTFLWSPNGETTEDLSSLAVGTYSVALTDAAGCVANGNVTIINSNAPQLSSTSVSSLCGLSNGSIDLIVAGGSSNLTYSWTGPNGFTSASEDISDLSEGSYSVEVTDNTLGCSSTLTVQIQNSNQSVLSLVSQGTICGPTSGSIQLTLINSTNPTFSWTGPNGFTASTQNISGLAVGQYSVTVTDGACGATGTATVTTTKSIWTQTIGVVSGSLYNFQMYAQNVVANSPGVFRIYIGDQTLGSFSSTGLNSWTEFNGSYTATYTGVAEIKIVNTNLSSSGNDYGIDDLSLIEVCPSVPPVGSTCGNNILVNGSFESGNSGFISQYTFVPNGPANNELIPEGTYSVAANANTLHPQFTGTGRSGNFMVVNGNEVENPNLTFTSVGASCSQNNGSINLTVTNFTTPISYSWTGPNGFTATTQDINGLASGIYVVSVTSGACVALGSVNVGFSNLPELTFATTDASCGASDASVDMSITNATNPTISWSGPDGFVSSTEDLTNLESGTYFVTVTSGTCVVEDSVNVSTEDILLTLTSTPTECGATTGTIALNITNGINPTFSWAGPNGFTASTEDLSDLSAGLYSVTVTSANCVSTDSVEVTTNEPILSLTSTPTACGASSGSIDLSVTNANIPSFSWTGPNGYSSTSEDLIGLAEGTYSVTVTDGLCIVSDSVIVEVDEPILVLSATPANCLTSNGEIALTISNSTNPSFSWTGPDGFTASTEDLTNLAAGTYFVTVTDGACSVEDSIEVIVNEPALEVSSTPASCGDSNGSIDLTVTNSINPSYSWVGPDGFTATSEDIVNLSAGSYSLTLTDGACIVNETVIINSVGGQLDVVVSTSGTSCGLCNGAATATVNSGTAPFTYLWSNGSTVSNPSNLCAGEVIVSVTDSAGCSSVFTSTIDPSSPLTITSVETPSLCGNPVGAIDLTVSGGSSTFTFAWSGPDGFTASSEDITSVSEGDYVLVISDAVAGCDTTLNFTITNTNSFTIEAVVSDATCNQNNGSVTLTLTGAVQPLTFLWCDGQTTQNATGLAPGSCSVTVTDGSGCTITQPVTIGNLPAFTISGNATNASCGQCNGSIQLQLTNAANPVSYVWSNGATTSTITNLCVGDYDVTITDANGCSDSYATSISGSTSPDVTSIVTNTECGLSSGAIDISVTDGSLPFSFSWTGPSSFTASTEDIANLSAGSYNVVVTDALGCTANLSTTVINTNDPVLAFATTNTSCGASAGAIDLSIVSAFPGPGPFTYTWTGPNGFNSTDEDLTGLNAGTYTVVVSSGACSVSGDTTIINTDAPSASISLSDNEICANESINLTIDVTGNGPFTFVYSDGISNNTETLSSAGTFSVAVNPSSTTTYTLVSLVSDIDPSCAGSFIVPSASVTVNSLPAVPTISASGPLSFCEGGSVILTSSFATGNIWNQLGPDQLNQSITVTESGEYFVSVTNSFGCTDSSASVLVDVIGGVELTAFTDTSICAGYSIQFQATGADTYLWSPSIYLSGTIIANPICTPLDTTTYIVTGTNSCGVSTDTIIVNTLPIVNVNLGDDQTICAGQTVNLSVENVPGATYSWEPSGYFIGSDTTSSVSFISSVATSITVTSTNVNGCVATDTLQINIITPPTAPVITAQGPTTFCEGDSVVLESSTGNFVIWSNGLENFNQILVTTSGSYYVTATDGICPATSDTIIVTVIPTPEASFTLDGDTAVCEGTCVNITADQSTGISWSFPDGTESTSQAISACLTGDYILSVTENGCVGTESVTIFVSPLPTAPVITLNGSDVICEGESALLQSSYNTGNQWNIDGVVIDGSIGNAHSTSVGGLFTVTYTDEIGCSSTSTGQLITIKPTSPLTIASSADTLICGNNPQPVVLTANPGFASYEWSTNEVGNSITINTEGTYIVTGTNQFGCETTASITFTTAPNFELDLNSPIYFDDYNVTINGGTDGSINLTVNPIATYTYLWSNGQTTEDLSNIPAGTYSVTVTNESGCIEQGSVNVKEPEAIKLPNTFSPNGDGFNDFYVIKGIQGYPDSQLDIFNRWGNLVYSKKGYTNDWNGLSNNGSELPDGTYFIVVDLNMEGKENVKGSIDIKRK
jgi:gliding motility-associated-like protein